MNDKELIALCRWLTGHDQTTAIQLLNEWSKNHSGKFYAHKGPSIKIDIAKIDKPQNPQP